MGTVAVLAAAPALQAAEDARVLPAGRSRFGFTYAQSGEISKTYNGGGKPESLTEAYQFDLNSRTISSIHSEMQRLVDSLNAYGIRYDSALRDTPTRGATTDPSKPLMGDALTRGHLGTSAIAQRQQYNFSFQHGVTDRLSVGVMVPYLRTAVDVSYDLTGANTAADIYAAMATRYNSTPLDSYFSFISASSPETLQQILMDRGYSRFEDRVTTGPGDAVFGGRYNYFKSDVSIQSVQLGVTAPTGRVSPPSELTEVSTGQGAWDAGLAHLWNYDATSKLMLSQGLHYTHRLPSYQIKRVRESPSDLIPSSISDERVRTQLGHKAWITAGARYKFSDTISIDCGYEWYWKTKDRYQGTRNKDYGYLSDKTNTYLETAQVGMSLSSIQSFLQNEFLAPGEFLFNFYWPTRGRNTVIAPYGTAELALYF